MPERDEDEPITVQVLFRPADGRDLTAADTTGARVAGRAPDPDGVALVEQELIDAGFTLGPADPVGLTRSVSAPAPAFEQLFATSRPVPGAELPLSGLSAVARQHVQAVTWSPDPDFGPGSFA